jgi:SanA protein
MISQISEPTGGSGPPEGSVPRGRRIRRALIAMLLCAVGLAGFIAAVNVWIVQTARGRIVSDIAQLRADEVALVLGTAPKLAGGRWKNPFFENRMDAAALLYRAGKVRHLLVSGDNHHRSYDEPSAMRDALIARGVPAAAITLDYAGFRTLDSLARARAVFQLQQLIVVTDAFHQPRALFLARASGVDAVGYPSRPVPMKWAKKTLAREVASRVKAWLDVFVLRTQPKFYGPAEPIKATAAARPDSAENRFRTEE